MLPLVPEPSSLCPVPMMALLQAGSTGLLRLLSCARIEPEPLAQDDVRFRLSFRKRHNAPRRTSLRSEHDLQSATEEYSRDQWAELKNRYHRVAVDFLASRYRPFLVPFARKRTV